VSSSGTSFSPVPLPDLAAASPGTAVFLDASAAEPPTSRTPERSFVAAPVDEPSATEEPAGYVVYELDGAAYAVAVEEVHEIVRRARLQPVPGARAAGGDVVLVDVRGRSIPVLDARRDRGDARPAQVLLPVYRHQVGLVVDRVLAVRADLEVEQDELSPVLPARALVVLRPAEGGDPILRVELPSATELVTGAGRRTP
jgi:chemotaxis signal transduction protein